MAESKPKLEERQRSSSYSASGKPVRILKLRAKKVAPQENLRNSDSDISRHLTSSPNNTPPVEICRKVVNRGTQVSQSPVLGPPHTLVYSVPGIDSLKRNSPLNESPLKSYSLPGDTGSGTWQNNSGQNIESIQMDYQEKVLTSELDTLLDSITIASLTPNTEAQPPDYGKSIDKLALDSGVELSPLIKNSPPGHSTFKAPLEVIPFSSNPNASEQISLETVLLSPLPLNAFITSGDLHLTSSYDSDLDKATVSSLTKSSSIPSILADRSSTASSVRSSEEQEEPIIPIHNREISLESDISFAPSITSTFRDSSPQPSLRSMTVTPASERIHVVTPSDEFDQIPDDITLLLYELQNGEFCGYNIDLFLDHHAVLKAMYSCPQCKCIIRDPQFCEWETCCKLCLPKLRSPQKVKHAIFDKHLNKKIQSLPVKCPLTGRGCQWRGKLKQMEGHLKKNCDYMRFRCPHTGCDEVFYKKNLEIHVSGECGQRRTNCPHCNTEVPVLSFNEHLIYVPCPKECSETEIPQCQLGLHILKQCARIMVPCPYSSYGCEDNIPRGKIREHMIVQNGEHLRLLRTLVDDSRSTIEKLVEENENLQIKIESGRRESNFLEKHINLPGTLLWKIPKIFNQMKNKHVVESKEVVINGYRLYALLWFGGWHSPGDVELGIIHSEVNEGKEWPVYFKLRYTIIHPTDTTKAIVAESTAKFDQKQVGEKKEKTWKKAQGFVGGFIPVQTQHQLHAFLMDGSLYVKVEIELVNPLPVL